MSDKEIYYDSNADLAESVRSLLAEAGPMSAKDIVKHLRRSESPKVQPSAVRKVLDQILVDEVERLPKKMYRLIETEE
jgi:hypothetical protein